VTGEKEFLALLERLEVPKPKAGEKGLYEFPGKDDDKGRVLLRFDAGHAYIAVGKDPTAALAPKALVPAAKLYEPADKSFASVKVHFDRFPKGLRDEVAASLKGLKTKLDDLRLPADASAPARKAVDELVKLGNRYADLLQDAETAGARLILDATTGEAGIQIGLTGKPGSQLAKIIAQRTPSTNKFAGLITPDTVAGVNLQLPLFAKELQSASVVGLEAIPFRVAVVVWVAWCVVREVLQWSGGRPFGWLSLARRVSWVCVWLFGSGPDPFLEPRSSTTLPTRVPTTN
jgi:hypothetical protein